MGESRVENELEALRDGGNYEERPQSRVESLLQEIIQNGSGSGGGGGSVTVDSNLSETSTHPVQNKVITAKIKEIEKKIPEEIDVDSELSEESENPVQNKVISAKIKELEENSNKEITVDDELSEESENPVQNKVITEAINQIKSDIPDEVIIDSELSLESENPLQNKVISSEIEELNVNKADIESPNFSGKPTAPTANIQSNDLQIATTAFVKAVINALINGAPETLDTLKEIADAIEENADVVDAINEAIGNKVSIYGDTFINDDDDSSMNINNKGLIGDGSQSISDFYDVSAEELHGYRIYYNNEDIDERYLNKDDYAVNTLQKDGIVKSGNGHSNEAWMTDENGNPDWRPVPSSGSVDTSDFLSLKKGGTVNNNFRVNKVSTTNPTEIIEMDIHNDGKVAFNTKKIGNEDDKDIGGKNNSLMHLSGGPENGEITILGENFSIKHGNINIGKSYMDNNINLLGSLSNIHANDIILNLNEFYIKSNPGTGGMGTTTFLNVLSNTIELGGSSGVGVVIRQSNESIKIGKQSNYIIEGSYSDDLKYLKLRGGSNANISIDVLNNINIGSEEGMFAFRSFNTDNEIVLTIVKGIDDGRYTEITSGGIHLYLPKNNLPYSDGINFYNSDENLIGGFGYFTDNSNNGFYVGKNIDNRTTLFVKNIKSTNSNYVGDTEYGKNIIYVNETQFGIRVGTSSASTSMYLNHQYKALIGNSETSLGASISKWKEVYAVNGTIQTSDKNEKNSIHEITIEQAEKLIYGSIPKTYRMNNGTHNRTHWGLISQDVEELIKKLGWSSLDFAGFIKSPKVIEITVDEFGNPLETPILQEVEGEYNYGLRYEEYIAPHIKVTQSHGTRIESLETTVKEQKETIKEQNKKIKSLEERILALESLLLNA